MNHSQDCPVCNGYKSQLIVDKANGYQFRREMCETCGGKGYVMPDTREGMFLCGKCGNKNFDFKHLGWLCPKCDIEFITSKNYARVTTK